MARCVCIRCLGTGREPRGGACELCHGNCFLDGIYPEAAAVLHRHFPTYGLDDEEDEEQEPLPEIDRDLMRSARLNRRAACHDTQSTEQRLAKQEARWERLLARVERLEAGEKRGGRG